METRGAARSGVDAPPWLWLWMALYLAGLPGLAGLARSGIEGLVQWQASLQRLRAVDPGYGRLEWLLVPSLLLDVLPAAALLLGLAVVFLPSLRRRSVERRYRLGAPTATLPAVCEIVAWVHAQCPGLAVRANVLRPTPLAFVYPTGYGRAALAVFGGLVMLWRSDRAAAEAVLRHELAHHARGDVAILGVGSLFESVIRFTGLYYVGMYVIPALIVIAAGALRLRSETSAIAVPADDVWAHQLHQLATLHAPGMAAITAGYLFRIVATLIVPLAGIWSAEFAADRRVAAAFDGEEGVRRALAATAGRRIVWWRWLLMRLSHPPIALRRWMLQARGRPAALAMLLAFPAAYALRLLALHAFATASYAVAGYTVAEIGARTIDNTLAFLGAQATALFAMGALLLLWPLARAPWQRLWTRNAPADPAPSVAPYAAVALLLLALGLVSLAL